VLEVAGDDGEGGAEFVRGVGDEVMTDLICVDARGDVTHDKVELVFRALNREGEEFDFPMR